MHISPAPRRLDLFWARTHDCFRPGRMTEKEHPVIMLEVGTQHCLVAQLTTNERLGSAMVLPSRRNGLRAWSFIRPQLDEIERSELRKGHLGSIEPGTPTGLYLDVLLSAFNNQRPQAA